jgi:hypothetical protein
VLVDIENLAVGGHHLSGEHVVDGEAVLADDEAHAAAERDPTEADARGVAEPGREAAFAGRPGVVAGVDAGLRPSCSAISVDFNHVHRREVEDYPALGRTVASTAVAAATHRELGAGSPCQSHNAPDFRCVADADNGLGPTVEASEERLARFVVFGVVRADYLAFQAVRRLAIWISVSVFIWFSGNALVRVVWSCPYSCRGAYPAAAKN